MDVFERVLAKEHSTDSQLGVPLYLGTAWARRMNYMANLRGGDGFRVPALEPRKDAQGLTRGERKRKSREIAMSKVSETRLPEFMHSSARSRLESSEPRAMTGFVGEVAA